MTDRVTSSIKTYSAYQSKASSVTIATYLPTNLFKYVPLVHVKFRSNFITSEVPENYLGINFSHYMTGRTGKLFSQTSNPYLFSLFVLWNMTENPVRDKVDFKGLCFYSYRKASTGFLVATSQLCQLTINNAIPDVIIPARAKIHQLNPVL